MNESDSAISCDLSGQPKFPPSPDAGIPKLAPPIENQTAIAFLAHVRALRCFPTRRGFKTRPPRITTRFLSPATKLRHGELLFKFGTLAATLPFQGSARQGRTTSQEAVANVARALGLKPETFADTLTRLRFLPPNGGI